MEKSLRLAELTSFCYPSRAGRVKRRLGIIRSCDCLLDSRHGFTMNNALLSARFSNIYIAIAAELTIYPTALESGVLYWPFQ